MFKKKNLFIYFNLLILTLLATKSLFLYQQLEDNTSRLSSYYNQKIEIRARVCKEADVNYRYRRLVLCLPEKVLITTSLYPEYNYGDVIVVEGKLQEAPILDDFNYRKYLKGQGIEALFYYPKISLEKSGNKDSKSLYLYLYKFKWQCQRIINRGLPEPEASLANTLILGYKKLLYEEDKEAFSKAGLSHLIVISGTHISILAGLILSFLIFLRLSRKLALRLVLVFLIIYPFLVGLGPASVRASIMGGLVFFAYYHGRLSKSINALLLSANLMLLFNPLLLFMDIGFQLSYTAVLGIIYIYPLGSRLKRRSGLIKNNNSFLTFISEAIILTISCQLAVFPIVAYHFHSFSTLSFIANPLISWILPPLIASLLFAIILSLLFPVLAIIFFTPSYFLINFFNKYAHFFASYSKFILEINNFKILHVLIYYSLLISLVYLFKKYYFRNKRQEEMAKRGKMRRSIEKRKRRKGS